MIVHASIGALFKFAACDKDLVLLCEETYLQIEFFIVGLVKHHLQKMLVF